MRRKLEQLLSGGAPLSSVKSAPAPSIVSDREVAMCSRKKETYGLRRRSRDTGRASNFASNGVRTLFLVSRFALTLEAR